MADSSIRTTPELTQDYLRQRLHYEPSTGVFTWLKKREGVRRRGGAAWWNTRYAETRAGSVKSHGYIAIFLDGKKHWAHRLAWLYMTGKWPNQEIDHRDLNGLNNRWDNLRQASRRQNNGNHPVSAKNTSGYKGVCFYEKRWRATIKVHGKSKHLGCFDTPEAAHAAYCKAAREVFGEFARYG